MDVLILQCDQTCDAVLRLACRSEEYKSVAVSMRRRLGGETFELANHSDLGFGLDLALILRPGPWPAGGSVRPVNDERQLLS